MKKIGLTGGIGSGKTTISKVFELLKIPIYNSDNVAKNFISKNSFVKNQIFKSFGEEIMTNNKIDNKKLSTLIFNDMEKINIINNIIHPLVKEDFNKWCKKKKSKYIIKESALLFSSNSFLELDEIIFVKSSMETRIKRVMKRDNRTKKQVKSIIKNQNSDEFLEKSCKYIIYNDEDKFLTPQIMKLHEIFTKLI
tara:strand:+ start:1651 stop:2235 length:585 start_codon:yes stop_codon:yes gene_type:complete